jgi:hypothetical protein
MATYYPEADRLDVALRVVVGLATGRMAVRGTKTWDILGRLGLDRKECEEPLFEALTMDYSIHSDAGLAHLLKHCRWLLPAALELLREFQSVTCESRYAYYNSSSRKEVETA